MLSNRKIALIGADGQLGTDLSRELQGLCQFFPLTLHDINITDINSINNSLSKINPDIVISTAGISNVPNCEKEPLEAYNVNSVGMKFLTDWCQIHDSKLVFFSTDYVFDGERNEPYTEYDKPNPINTYGISKYAAELYITSNHSNFIIARITGLYGHNTCLGKPKPNFVESFISLIKNKDELEFDGRETCSPSYTPDIATQIAEMLKLDLTGIFHVVNQGHCSWFEFGKAIIDELGTSIKFIHKKRENVNEATQNLYQDLKRPNFTALKNLRLEELGINKMRHWRKALHQYIVERNS
jgi:dTDP-4-dehydrorhamnose reductase